MKVLDVVPSEMTRKHKTISDYVYDHGKMIMPLMGQATLVMET